MKTAADRQRVIEALESAVRAAHQVVFERGSSESDKQGMGTTLDVLLIAGGDAFVAHVGDSRTYLIRDGAAAQITTDHTVAEVLLIEGKLSPEEAAASHLRTVLVNAIGVAPQVGVEMAHFKLKAGDFVLLCSDGLHDYFPVEQELADNALNSEGLETALEGLVELAKQRGGHDNITGVLLKVISAPDSGLELSLDEAAPTLQGDAIPEPVVIADTLPIDADAALEAVDSKIRGPSDPKIKTRGVAHAKTEEREAAVVPDADKDRRGDGDDDGDEKAEDHDEALPASDLKTTVPMKPLKMPGTSDD